MCVCACVGFVICVSGTDLRMEVLGTFCILGSSTAYSPYPHMYASMLCASVLIYPYPKYIYIYILWLSLCMYVCMDGWVCTHKGCCRPT